MPQFRKYLLFVATASLSVSALCAMGGEGTEPLKDGVYQGSYRDWRGRTQPCGVKVGSAEKPGWYARRTFELIPQTWWGLLDPEFRHIDKDEGEWTSSGLGTDKSYAMTQTFGSNAEVKIKLTLSSGGAVRSFRVQGREGWFPRLHWCEIGE